MKHYYKIILFLTFSVLFTPRSVLFGQDVSIHVIFDASSGMQEIVNGKTKFDHARDFVQKLLRSNITAKFGLTVIGSEAASGNNAYFSPVPPIQDAENAIMDEIQKLKPEGKSPIASALTDAGNVVSTGDANYMLLVTNGVENAGGAPAAVALQLLTDRKIVRLDVIGFEQTSQDNPLLSEIVLMGGGIYKPTWDTDAIIADYVALTSVVITPPTGMGLIGYRSFINNLNTFPAYGTTVELINSAGQKEMEKPFWRGVFEDVKPGKYVLNAKNGGQTQSLSVEAIPGQLVERNFVFNIATGGFTYTNYIKNTNNGSAFGTITRVYHKTGETVFTGTSWRGSVNDLPEGIYKVEGLYESLPPQEKSVTIKAGEMPQIRFEYDVGRGRISYQCFLDSARAQVANGTVIKIIRMPYNELALELSQWRGTTPFLPIGLYNVEGNYKGINRTKEVTIHPDSTSDLSFIFNIRQVRLNYRCFRNRATLAPANGVNVSIVDINGQEVEQATRWRGSFNLPEGIYTIVANYQGKIVRKNINLVTARSVLDEDVYFDQDD